jgi:hypothetical protein
MSDESIIDLTRELRRLREALEKSEVVLLNGVQMRRRLNNCSPQKFREYLNNGLPQTKLTPDSKPLFFIPAVDEWIAQQTERNVQ